MLGLIGWIVSKWGSWAAVWRLLLPWLLFRSSSLLFMFCNFDSLRSALYSGLTFRPRLTVCLTAIRRFLLHHCKAFLVLDSGSGAVRPIRRDNQIVRVLQS
jgi:hypothetical protein